MVLIMGGSMAFAKVETYKSSVFPYPVERVRLKNGLDIILIPMPEFKNMVSYNTMVLAGARNEVEKGKTGLAHLFEHILFRHQFGGKENGYNKMIDRLGAHNNAWTWFDVTYYHPFTFSRNLLPHEENGEKLPGLIDLESSRFMELSFTKKIFQTEAGAVLGEYRRISSFPSTKMSEKLLALQFPHHPYGHTTMGYYEDVLDMPNEYEAAYNFYKTYYRPNNVFLVIAGDIRVNEILPYLEKTYKNWEPGDIPQIKATGSPPNKPQRAHITWDADVPPIVWVSYRMPAFRPGTRDSAVVELLYELLVGKTAPLYKKLRYEKQTVSQLSFAEGTMGFESFDERVMIIDARLYKDFYVEKGKAYLDDVIQDVIQGVEDLKHFSGQKDAGKKLEALKTRIRYDLIDQFSSPSRVASLFSWYYRFDRQIDVFDRLLDSISKLTPEAIDTFAQKYFIPERQAIVTLSYDKKEVDRASR